MPDVRRYNNGIALTQLGFLISRDRVFDPTFNHDQRFRAVGVVMTAIRVARLQDAPANRHIVTVAEGPIGKPGKIAPSEFLTLRFALGKDLNLVGHGNEFFNRM